MWTSSVKASCVWTSSGVDKLCVTGGGDGSGSGRRTGCRTKNKNPTQRCGEKVQLVACFVS